MIGNTDYLEYALWSRKYYSKRHGSIRVAVMFFLGLRIEKKKQCCKY